MPRLTGDRYFPRVKEAREALKNKALEIHDTYMAIIHAAFDAGDLETAMKATQWLIEHMPAEDGKRMVDASIDKPKQIEQKQGPQVNIGFALGGIAETRALPAVTIDVTPIPELGTETDTDE